MFKDRFINDAMSPHLTIVDKARNSLKLDAQWTQKEFNRKQSMLSILDKGHDFM